MNRNGMTPQAGTDAFEGVNLLLAESANDEPDFEPVAPRNGHVPADRPRWAMDEKTAALADGRPMPAATVAELCVIGSIILAPHLIDELSHSVDEFSDPEYAKVFGAMKALRSQNKPIDLALLREKLKTYDSETNWAGILAESMRAVPHALNAKHYSDEVKNAAQRRRIIFAAEEAIHSATRGTVSRSVLEKLEKSIEETRAGTTAAGSVLTYRTLTCAELDAAEYATEYLLEWMLVAGQPCIVGGPKKALKTSLLLALCFALATGRHFLGVFRVPRAVRVCMMTGESGLATIQETLRRIAQAEGFNLADVENLIISDQLPVFGNLQHIDGLKTFLAQQQIEVLVVDPAYLCLPTDGNEGSLFAMGQLLKSISDLCQSAGVTLILIHHTKKGVADPYAPPELEDISWAGFQEFARQWLLVGRREKYEPGTGRHSLWLNVGGSAGHNSAWAIDVSEGTFDGTNPRHWEVTVSKADEARRTAQEKQEDAKQQRRAETRRVQIDADKRAIIEAIGKTPSGDTKTGIRNRSVPQSARFNVALAELLNESSVITVTITKDNGIPYEGFRLKSDNDSEQRDASGRIGTPHQDSSVPLQSSIERDGFPIGDRPVPMPDCAKKKTKKRKRKPSRCEQR